MVESIFITLEPGQQERRLWIPNRSLKLMDAVQAGDPLAAVPEAWDNKPFTFERIALRSVFEGA
jgi:hypothetical protein